MNIDNGRDVSLHGDRLTYLPEEFAAAPKRLRGFFIRLLQKHQLRCQIRSERRALAMLDERELRDIGVDRVCAMAESKRRFTDVPGSRSN